MCRAKLQTKLEGESSQIAGEWVDRGPNTKTVADAEILSGIVQTACLHLNQNRGEMDNGTGCCHSSTGCTCKVLLQSSLPVG